MKLLLLILMIFTSIFATAQQEQIIFWPNVGCKIIKSKTIKCPNEKHLSWIVRMDSAVANYAKLSQENQDDEIKCRDDCFKSVDCLTIQVGLDSCRNFSYVNKFQYLKDVDVLQLACCDKIISSGTRLFLDFSNSVNYGKLCGQSKSRTCSLYPLWLKQSGPYNTRGRSIEIISYTKYYKTFCQEHCNQDISCTSFHDNEKGICLLKYYDGIYYEIINFNEVSANFHCCPSPVHLLIDNKQTDISMRIDMKYAKSSFFCPIGWNKQWINDTNVKCEVNNGIFTHHPGITVNLCLEKCWNESCAFLSFAKYPGGRGDCSLFEYFPSCIPDPSSTHDVAFLGCIKDIKEDLHLPNFTSVYSDCMFDKQYLIGYNGTVNKSTTNVNCIHWNLTYFNSIAFPNNNNQHNYCRNINNDPQGPWCITSGHHHMEYCSVPKCEKIPIKSNNYTLLRDCQISKPKQCNIANRHRVFVRLNNQNNCPVGLLARENISVEEYCFHACVFHPICQFAFFNSNQNVCILANNVTVCQNQDPQTKFSVVGINCCLQEQLHLDCPKVPHWFSILSSILYSIVILLFIINLCLQVKYNRMKFIAIDEYSRNDSKLLMKSSRKKFSESFYSRTDSSITGSLSQSIHQNNIINEETL